MDNQDDLLAPLPEDEPTAANVGGQAPQPQTAAPARTVRSGGFAVNKAQKTPTSKRIHWIIAGFLLLIVGIAFGVQLLIHSAMNHGKSAAKAAASKPLVVGNKSQESGAAGLDSLLQQQQSAAQQHHAPAQSHVVTGIPASKAAQTPRYGLGIPKVNGALSQAEAQQNAKASQIAASTLIALHGQAPQAASTQPASNPDSPSAIQQRIAKLREQEQTAYQQASNNNLGLHGPMASLAAEQAGLLASASHSTTNAKTSWQKSLQGGAGYGGILPTLPRLHRVALYPGTIIPAVTITRLDTQTPGTVTAQVTRTVYSNQGAPAIPAGSRLIGRYDGDVSSGQTRVMLGFTRVIFPDGKEIALQGMSGTGPRGADGVTGNVHTHFWTDLGSSLLVALISSGVDSIPNPNNNASGNTYIGSSGTTPTQTGAQVLDQQAQNLLQPYTNIQPTITVPAGLPFRIMVNKTIMLPEGD